jgi:hypothetical protein
VRESFLMNKIARKQHSIEEEGFIGKGDAGITSSDRMVFKAIRLESSAVVQTQKPSLSA